MSSRFLITASDVIAGTESGRLKKSGVKVMLHAEVKALHTEALPDAQIACEAETGKSVPGGKGNRERYVSAA